MSDQHPDRDSLSAFLEEALSIDATQWVEQHLAGCSECRARLVQEERLLQRLDGLGSVTPPKDFTQGVMARVAQYPAYQPAPEVQWRRLGLWAGSAAALVLATVGFIGWVLVSNTPAEGAQLPTEVSGGIAWFADAAKQFYFYVSRLVTPLLFAGLALLMRVVNYIRDSGTPVHLALLLITVALNYWLTRMVLNYQRRQ